jgi:hypothetical protein
VATIFAQFRNPRVNPYRRPLSITAQAYNAADEFGTPGSPPAGEILASMNEARRLGGISWSFYRLADSTNGATAAELNAIRSFPHWSRSNTWPAIPATAQTVN